jgi:hypothetical protein
MSTSWCAPLCEHFTMSMTSWAAPHEHFLMSLIMLKLDCHQEFRQSTINLEEPWRNNNDLETFATGRLEKTNKSSTSNCKWLCWPCLNMYVCVYVWMYICKYKWMHVRFVGLCGVVEQIMFGPLAKSCLKSCGVPCEGIWEVPCGTLYGPLWSPLWSPL